MDIAVEIFRKFEDKLPLPLLTFFLLAISWYFIYQNLRNRKIKKGFWIGLISIALGCGIWSVYDFSKNQLPSGKLIVAIADFEGTNEEEKKEGKGISRFIERELYDNLHPDWILIRRIGVVNSTDDAVKKGKRAKAYVVIWGSVEIRESRIWLNPYIKMIKPFNYPDLNYNFRFGDIELRGLGNITTSIATKSSFWERNTIKDFNLRRILSRDATKLITVLIGLLNYIGLKDDLAAEQFQCALNLFPDDQEVKGLIYKYQADCYYRTKKYNSALESLLRAINIFKRSGDLQSAATSMRKAAFIYEGKGAIDNALKYHREAKQLFNQTRNRKEEVSQLELIGLIYMDNLCDLDTASECFKNALGISKEIGYREGECIALLNLSAIYSRRGDLNRGIEYAKVALGCAEEMGNQAIKAAALLNIGSVGLLKGNFNREPTSLKKALRIFRKIGNRRYEVMTLINIGGHYYLNKGAMNEARKYWKDSLKISREIQYQWGELLSLTRIGMTYENEGSTETALCYYEDALKISKNFKYPMEKASILFNIGTIYEKNEPTKALKYYQEALEICEEIDSPEIEVNVLTHIGKSYFSMGKGPLALRYFTKKLKRYKELGQEKKNTAVVMELIGFAYQISGEVDNAIQYFNDAMELYTKLGLEEDRKRVRETLRRPKTSPSMKYTIRKGSLLDRKGNTIRQSNFFKEQSK